MSEAEKNKNPFRVPENYFDEVNRKILASTSEAPKVGTLPLFQKIKPVLAAAAAIAVLVTIGYFTVKLTDKRVVLPQVSEIFTIDPELLIDEIDLTSLENDAVFPGTLEEGSGLSNDEIIDYLISDDIDISVIYEKL